MMDAPLIGAFGFPRLSPVRMMLATGGLKRARNSPLAPRPATSSPPDRDPPADLSPGLPDRGARSPHPARVLKLPDLSFWELLKLTPDQLRQELSEQEHPP